MSEQGPWLRSLAVLGLAAAAMAQDIEAPPAVDPYSRGEPAAMERAGYVSFGPFPFVDRHSTQDVEEVLGHVPLLWVETAHFRIGSSLGPCLLTGDSRERERLRDELAALRSKLPRVPARPHRLDPWLRLHLFAQRCETLYTDWCERLGVDDADFPRDEKEGFAREIFMGTGPYLGMPEKFTVLLFGTESSFGRFFTHFVGYHPRQPQRHHFADSGTLLFATAAEYEEGRLNDDTMLHCHVTFNVVHNLVTGYRGYRHALPAWWQTGIATWYLRQVDPRWPNLNSMHAGDADERPIWRWRDRARALAEVEAFTPAEEMLRWLDWSGWSFDDHVVAWSRVEFLMSRDPDGLVRYMNVMKRPFHRHQRFPTLEEIRVRQLQALREAWGVDVDDLDVAWRRWVLSETVPD